MTKLNKIFIILAVILIVVLIVVIYWQKFGFEKSYSVVYLSDGNIYFGKISSFPKFHLTDVWFVRGISGEDNNLDIARFDGALWGPEDKIYINPEQIIWKSKLGKNSELLNRFRNFLLTK